MPETSQKYNEFLGKIKTLRQKYDKFWASFHNIYLRLRTNLILLFPYRKDHETDTYAFVTVRKIARGIIDYSLSGFAINLALKFWLGMRVGFFPSFGIALTLFVLSTLTKKIWTNFVEGMQSIVRQLPKR